MTHEHINEKNCPSGKDDGKSGSAEADLDLVRQIEKQSDSAWKEFVETFSPWVLYRSKVWCEKHCPPDKATGGCCLVSLHRQIAGNETAWRADECDDGMDSYIWIFEQLSRRIQRYEARRGSRLSTYVWKLLNSKEMYIDWLRWKYGRVI